MLLLSGLYWNVCSPEEGIYAVSSSEGSAVSALDDEAQGTESSFDAGAGLTVETEVDGLDGSETADPGTEKTEAETEDTETAETAAGKLLSGAEADTDSDELQEEPEQNGESAAAEMRAEQREEDAERKETESEYSWLEEHADLFADGKVEMAAGNPDLIHFLYTYAGGDYKIPENQKLTEEELGETIPELYQWDPRWGYDAYGDSVIGLSGCGPTALSMVAVGLTGNEEYTPACIADFAAQRGWYIDGAGTSWSLITRGSRELGLSVREVTDDERAVLRELDEGNPIILSMGPGIFTNTGHFLVLTGEQDGRISLHDPNSRIFTSQMWDYQTLQPMIRNIWVFTRDEGEPGG